MIVITGRERVAQHVVAHHVALRRGPSRGPCGRSRRAARRASPPARAATRCPSRLQPSTNAGSISWRSALPRQAEVAVEQRVDGVQAGHVVGRGSTRPEPTRTGEPAEAGRRRCRARSGRARTPAATSRRGRRGGRRGRPALFWWRADDDAEGDAPDAAERPARRSPARRRRQPFPQVRRDGLLGPERRARGRRAAGCCTYVTYCSMMPPSRPHRSLAAATTASLFIVPLADDRRQRVGRDQPRRR